jgi:hypothetical protein
MAALTAAGALTSMAQVYSVNMVGYININVPGPSKFSMLANQLNNTPNNTVATLMPAPPGGTVVYKFNFPLQAFDSTLYDGGAHAWTDPTITMNPGEGVFIFAPVAFTATFVGEVQLSSTVTVPQGGFSIASSVIPQQGYLHSPVAIVDGNADLLYGIPQNNEVVYTFDTTLQAYNSALWDAGSQNWGSATAPGPLLKVGEAFFNFTPGTSGNHAWTRNFSVGP